jgi:hypothetical protein
VSGNVVKSSGSNGITLGELSTGTSVTQNSVIGNLGLGIAVGRGGGPSEESIGSNFAEGNLIFDPTECELELCNV